MASAHCLLQAPIGFSLYVTSSRTDVERSRPWSCTYVGRSPRTRVTSNVFSCRHALLHALEPGLSVHRVLKLAP